MWNINVSTMNRLMTVWVCERGNNSRPNYHLAAFGESVSPPQLCCALAFPQKSQFRSIGIVDTKTEDCLLLMFCVL